MASDRWVDAPANGSLFSESLELLLPHLAPLLRDPDRAARIERSAARMAPILRGELDCPLAGHAPPTALRQCVVASQSEPELLQTHIRATLTETTPGAARLHDFLTVWSDAESVLGSGIAEVRLSIAADDASNGPGGDVPAISLSLSLPTDLFDRSKPFGVATQALDLLLGPVWRDRRNTLKRCFDACPEGVSVSHITVRPSHPAEALRVHVRRLSPDLLAPYLLGVGWPGPAREAEEWMTGLAARVDRVSLCLDVGNQIEPTLGFEAVIMQQPNEVQADEQQCWPLFLDDLVAQGLCTPARRDAVLDWPGPPHGSGQRITVRRYWDGPEERSYQRNYQRSTGDTIEQFRGLFTRAVADRLRTDRAGSHLSGGMDAGSIAATAHGLMGKGSRPFDLRSYTIVYRELCEEEEGRYARMIAEQTGFSCDELVAEDYLMRAPDEHPGFVAPEPFAIPELTAEVDIIRRVAGFARTLFTGFGGDPAFDFKPSHWGRLLRQGRGVDLIRDLRAYHQAFGRLPPSGLRTSYRNWRLRTRDFADVPDWIDPGFAARIGLRERQTELFSTHYASGRQGMAMAPLWPNIFAAADPGSSGFPVKLRFPFFDLALVEFLCTVPAGGWFPNKRLLRESMRGTLPDAVVQRPKTPLGTPPSFNKLARDAYREWQQDLTATSGITAYVDGPRLMTTLRASTSPIEFSKTMRIWPLAYWLKHRASTDPAQTV